MPGRRASNGHDGVAVPAPALALLFTVLMVLSIPPVMAIGGGGPLQETVKGFVFDERGTAAEGVLVRVENTSLATATDTFGMFTLTSTGLDGPGVLVISTEGYLTVRIAFSLEDGGKFSVSVYLVEEQEPPGEVSGTVLSFDGSLLQDATVTLSGGDGSSRVQSTGPDGGFRFGSVPASTSPYTITVEAFGYGTFEGEVAVTSGTVAYLEVVMLPRTPMELVRGWVTDTRGLPLPGATVTLEGSQASWTTDIDGHFLALVDGKLGERDVVVSLLGYEDRSLTVDIPGSGVATVEVELEARGEGGPETLWVRVINAITREPVEDATVTIDAMQGSWMTDATGVAIVAGLSLEGSRTVTATRENHTTSTGSFDLEEGGTGVVDIELTRVSNAVIIQGIVTDARTGSPLDGVTVTVDAQGIEWLVQTDAQGRFLVHRLPPGVNAVVTVSAQGYDTVQVELVLEEFKANILDLPLEASKPEQTVVTGTVMDRDGPVAGAKVTLWKEGFAAVTNTDEDGTYSVRGVPAEGGAVHYSVEDQFHVTATGTREVPAGVKEVRLDVRIEQSTTPMTLVTGAVTDPSGFPVSGARVVLRAGTGNWETRTVRGIYEFFINTGVDLHGELGATGEGFGWNNLTVTVRARHAVTVDLALPLAPGWSNIVGFVSSSPGKPLVGAEVHLQYSGVFHRTAITEMDGGYHFLLVPSRVEPYRLSVVAEGYDGVTVDALAEPGKVCSYDLVLNEDVTSVETIKGRVVGSDDRPIASAVVRVGVHHTVFTGPDGTFVLVGEDLEGWTTVSASSPGFETVSEDVEIEPSGTVSVELVLSVKDLLSTSVSGRVLSASGGRSVAGATVHLGWSGSTAWTFETVTDAKGGFSFDLVPKAWGAVTLSASASGFTDDSLTMMLSESQGLWHDFYLKELEPPKAPEPFITQEEARQVGVGVGVAVAAIALVMLTEVGKVALLGLFLVPLYTKIKREKVMDHFIRGRIYEYICHNPGVNYSAIKSQFDLTNGTVTYHLSMLERQEFIRAKLDGIYKRYFPNNGGPSASSVEPMSLQLSIARVVRERPGMTQKEIAKRLGSSKQLVSYHIRNMRESGELDAKRDGRSVRIFPNPRTPE